MLPAVAACFVVIPITKLMNKELLIINNGFHLDILQRSGKYKKRMDITAVNNE